MSINDDDLSQARAWLMMDQREHANRMAEMSKRRKAALAYSHEPVSFAPLPECRACDDPLSADNRSPIHGTCINCLPTQLEKPVIPLPPVRLPLWFYPALFAVAFFAGLGVAQALGWVAWAIGSAW